MSIYKARRAVAKVIKLLDTGWKSKVTKDNWFRRHGLKRKHVIECFGMDADAVMEKYNRLVRVDWSCGKDEKQQKLRDSYRAAQKRKARKNKIAEGLETAIAYAKGDKTKGTLMRYRVRNGTAMRIVK